MNKPGKNEIDLFPDDCEGLENKGKTCNSGSLKDEL